MSSEGYKTYQVKWEFPEPSEDGVYKDTNWSYPYESPATFKRYTPPESDIPVAKAMYAVVALVCICLALSGVIIALVEIVI